MSFLSLDIGDWDWRWTFDLLLMLKSYRVGGGWCIWILASALVLFWVLTFEIDIGDGPGPELDNNAKNWILIPWSDSVLSLGTYWICRVSIWVTLRPTAEKTEVSGSTGTGQLRILTNGTLPRSSSDTRAITSDSVDCRLQWKWNN